MKLRNKKTGEVVDLSIFGISLSIRKTEQPRAYHSLADLNEEWEDYVPKDPLIEDEKIRKAVRAWWETIPDAVTDKRVVYKNNNEFEVGIYSIYCGAIYPETFEKCRMYTIDELCGEEEE